MSDPFDFTGWQQSVAALPSGGPSSAPTPQQAAVGPLTAGLHGGSAAYNVNYSPLTSSLQQQAQASGTGWVTFDEGPGNAFAPAFVQPSAPAPAPTPAPTTSLSLATAAPTAQPPAQAVARPPAQTVVQQQQQWTPPFPDLIATPMPAAGPLISGLGSSPPHSMLLPATAGLAAVAAGPRQAPVQPHMALAAQAPGPATARPAPAFPTFASIHGAAAAPGSTTAAPITAPAASAPMAPAPAFADTLSSQQYVTKRLPRPPAAAGATVVGPAAPVPAPAAALSNPFAPAPAAQHPAVRRSIDPFTELAVTQPAITKAPSMAEARAAKAVAPAPPGGATQLGGGLSGAPAVLQPLPAQPPAAVLPAATSGTAHGLFALPHMPAVTASTAPLGMPVAPAAAATSPFPSFAALYGQQQPLSLPPKPPAALQPAPVSPTAAVAAGLGSAAAGPTAGSTGSPASETIIETTSLDLAQLAGSPTSGAAAAAGSGPATPQRVVAGRGQSSFEPLDAPPSYEEVTAMDQQQLPLPAAAATAAAPTAWPSSAAAIEPPPSYEDAIGLSASLSPPPAYDDAVAMSPAPPLYPPQARSPTAASSPNGGAGLPPPPPYESVVSGSDSLLAPPQFSALHSFGRLYDAAHTPNQLDAVGSPGSADVDAQGHPIQRLLPILPSEDARPTAAAAPADGWVPFSSVNVAAADAAQQISLPPAASLARQARPAVKLPVGSLDQPFMLNPQHLPQQATPPPSQLCVEVRLPPLKPKGSVLPRRLGAGLGSLFAVPGGKDTAALQFNLSREGAGQGSDSEPCFALPYGSEASEEDWDSAPAGMLRSPEGVSSKVCCSLVDEASRSMWTGHQDGKVVRWSIAPGRAALPEHHWQAHRIGKVASLCLNAWGELWTASSSGSVRVWQYTGGVPGSRQPIKLFDCRRSRLVPGQSVRLPGPRPHSKARLLAAGPSGRVVWSAGKTVIALWGAYDGDFLGAMEPGCKPDELADLLHHLRINPALGLDREVIVRPFLQRPQPEGWDDEENEPALGMQVVKGVTIAAKFAAKLGKKIKQNVMKENADDVAGKKSAARLDGDTAAPDSRGNIKALVPSLDGCMLVAFKNGTVEKYSEWGRLIWSKELPVHVLCMALVGPYVWLGCSDGHIVTLAVPSGEQQRRWHAHDFAVVCLALGSGLVYSLDSQASIRAWPVATPSDELLAAWKAGLSNSLRRHELRVLACTWNVNETAPAPASLRHWLAKRSAGAHIVSIALQEVEMGTAVARDAAWSLVNKSALERGSENARAWAGELLAAIGGDSAWVRVGLRQMSGLVLVVFCRRELQRAVGEVATAGVACGVMGVGGNKGAVAVTMSVHRRRVVFVCSHFAAHQHLVEERNNDYLKIARTLHFANTARARAFVAGALPEPSLHGGDSLSRDAWVVQSTAGVPSTSGGAFTGPSADSTMAVATLFGASDGLAMDDASALGRSYTDLAEIVGAAADVDDHGPGLSEAALLVWAGDFNYRINGTYDDVVSKACVGAYQELFLLDQCRQEMARGAVFRSLCEPLPHGYPLFPPTYKYDKGQPVTRDSATGALRLPYDTSEKQRVPAWTDRILVRGSLPGSNDVCDEDVSVYVRSAEDYSTVLELNDSDHKPVHAHLMVTLPAYMQDMKRKHSLRMLAAIQDEAIGLPPPQHLLDQHLQHAASAPPAAAAAAASLQQQHGAQLAAAVVASPSVVGLQPNAAAPLKVHVKNEGHHAVAVTVTVDPALSGTSVWSSDGSLPTSPTMAAASAAGSCRPLPFWLELSPCRFVLAPNGGTTNLLLRAQLPAGSWRPERLVLRLRCAHVLAGRSGPLELDGPAVTVSLV